MSKKTTIAHSLEELEDQVILTLVDRPILENGDLNLDQDDVLQNEDIQISNEAKHNIDLKSKIKSLADASLSHLQAKNEGHSGLLPHYDDHSYKPNTIELDDGVVIKARRPKKNKNLGSDYHENDTLTTKLNSQYSTRKEDKHSKPKASAKDLLSFLDDTAEDNVTTVKTEIQNLHIIEDSIDQLKKKRILDNGIKNIVNSVVLDDDEEESMLLRSIERSRKKVEIKSKPYNVLEAIKEEEQEEHEKEAKTVEIELNPIAYKSSEAVRQNHQVELKDAVGGTASVMYAKLPSERLAKKTVETEEIPEKFGDFTKEEMLKMREQVQFLEDKVVGTGLGGTLAYLRENSLLGKEEQVGRHNDKTIDYNDPNDRVHLEYRNASGQLMKSKEAYRYICAKFHGEGSSKNKIEIRKKRDLQDLRMKQKTNSDGQLLKLLKLNQEKSGEAGMVLNLGGKMKQ